MEAGWSKIRHNCFCQRQDSRRCLFSLAEQTLSRECTVHYFDSLSFYNREIVFSDSLDV